MRATRRFLLGLTLVGCIVGLFAVNRAFALSFNLDTPNATGSSFTGPYANVSVSFVNSTTANITFTSLTNGGYIYLLGDGSSAALNVNATSFSVSAPTGTSLSGFTAPTFTVTNPPGTSNVNGFGTFNAVIDNSNGFTNSVDSISFTLTNLSGTWASDGDVLTPNGNNALAAAHVFACLTPCSASAGAAATFFVAGSGGTVPPTEVPEPSTLLLLGSGLLVLSAFVRRQSHQR